MPGFRGYWVPREVLWGVLPKLDRSQICPVARPVLSSSGWSSLLRGLMRLARNLLRARPWRALQSRPPSCGQELAALA